MEPRKKFGGSSGSAEHGTLDSPSQGDLAYLEECTIHQARMSNE